MEHDERGEYSLGCANCGTRVGPSGMCECQRIDQAKKTALWRDELERKFQESIAKPVEPEAKPYSYHINLAELDEMTEANVRWAEGQRR